MRIPTYTFKKTPSGLEVFGSGTIGNKFPNLVFIRDKDYRFIFLSRDSAIIFYDKNHNILFKGEYETDSLGRYKPTIFKFGENFPNSIFYRCYDNSGGNIRSFGKISIRDYGNVTGKVISYGYARNSIVYDKKNHSYVTDETGLYQINLNNLIESDNDTYFSNFDLFTKKGFDSAVLNLNKNTYSDELLFNFSAPAGCLNVSSLTSVLHEILNKTINLNYRDVERKMQLYFGFSENFDPTIDDPIYSYITNKISLDDFIKYILFTTIVELNFRINKQSDEDHNKFIYSKIADEILDGLVKFNYDVVGNYFDDVGEQFTKNKFENLYLILSARMFQLDDTTTKKVCILESIYDYVYKFRNSVYIPELVSDEVFLQDDFKFIANSVNVPSQSFYVLATSIKDCSVAPFGNYAKIKITENLIRSVFNQELPIEPEIINKLINKTIYIEYKTDDNSNYFCYKILDFIDFDYDLFTINDETTENKNTKVLSGFDSEIDCCALEKILKDTEQEKNLNLNLDIAESKRYEMVLYNIDKNKISEISITNKNYPFKQSSSRNIFYLDEFIDDVLNMPSFICIPKEYSDLLDEDDTLKLNFDNKNRVQKVTQIRYDYARLKITDVFYQNGVLVLNTNEPHGYVTGDKIVIRNASKNSIIEGSHLIKGVSNETQLTIDFKIPTGVTLNEINGSYAEFDTLNTSKIYADTTLFDRGDYIMFESALESKNENGFKIIDINRDYVGNYLLVSGHVPRNVNCFVKVGESSHIHHSLSYSLNSDPLKLNLNDVDLDLFKIYTPTVSGELARNLNRKIISSVEFKLKKIELDTPDDDLPIGDDILLQNTNEQIPSLENFSSIIDLSKKKTQIYKPSEISYHFSRSYLRREYDLADYDEVKPEYETFDWNNDGVVGTDELKILERFLLTSPRTVEEYNTNLGDYPMASVLPNASTAFYACQENCCHDDFTESTSFTLDDVYIYDAFQTYMDSIGVDQSDYVEFRLYYDSLVTQGIAEALDSEIIYMPTTPTEFKFCGDYTESGTISPEDAHIYYAHQLYAAANGGDLPATVDEFNAYYITLVDAGIVPSLISPIEKLPSLSNEDTITTDDGELDKNCEQITGKDLAIYNEWIRQGKPTDIDLFNTNRLEGVPRACFLPADDDGYDGGDYEQLGSFEVKKSEIYAGLEHL